MPRQHFSGFFFDFLLYSDFDIQFFLFLLITHVKKIFTKI
jgi:hypothetical protein